MPWNSLARRVTKLPLILSGPLLRKTTSDSVTVWLALQEPRSVTLQIYARDENGVLLERFSGSQPTIRLDEHVHLVAVTARTTDPQQKLLPDTEYFYNVFFEPYNSQNELKNVSLLTPGILFHQSQHPTELQKLVYPGRPLPGFILPAKTIKDVRVVHGSCRKPHGVGHEMLSALDTIIAHALKDASDKQALKARPQQIYLTGDQIYADDVATPLLFLLMDAITSLLPAHAREILPVIHKRAQDLLPGKRADIVDKYASFTSTHAENHLISLAEYAAMYLFVWSDVLWPDELPDINDFWQVYPALRPHAGNLIKMQTAYEDQLNRLNEFRSHLPEVRRALANTPTYMICDDHDVTDDWFLDGAWCQRALSRPVGQRIIRNGMLAYALFQAWGNTPEQFEQGQGANFLAAIDRWQGNEESQEAEIIQQSIGIPLHFRGSGVLRIPEKSLYWHYQYQGPDYQIIVMDTRTQRFYRSENDFPGLLSPQAMQTQLLDVMRPDSQVTIIISAAPVLGIDFIETVQFWTRFRVQSNYAYDREAWALEWGTFQRLVRAISQQKRIVFLSGDVHYAFGAEMAYWDHHSKQTARIVNYTASALHNEGSGSQITVLAVGYPRLKHLLRHHNRPGLDFFVWDIVGEDRHILNYLLSLIRRNFIRFWWSIPRLIDLQRSTSEIVLPAWGWFQGAFDSFPPDRSYRLHYLPNTLEKVSENAHMYHQHRPHRHLLQWFIRPLQNLRNSMALLKRNTHRVRRLLTRQRQKIQDQPRFIAQPAQKITAEAIEGIEALEKGLEKPRGGVNTILSQTEQWLDKWKAGPLIVGYNNIGEISFDWNDEHKSVTQRLWWYHPDEPQKLRRVEYQSSLELPLPSEEPPLP